MKIIFETDDEFVTNHVSYKGKHICSERALITDVCAWYYKIPLTKHKYTEDQKEIAVKRYKEVRQKFIEQKIKETWE